MLTPTDEGPSLRRELSEFALGAIGGSVTAGLLFLCFHPLPAEPDPRDHTREALLVIGLVSCFCGGFVGRRAFSPESWMAMMLPVGKSLLFGLLLCWMIGMPPAAAMEALSYLGAGLLASLATGLVAFRMGTTTTATEFESEPADEGDGEDGGAQ